MTSAASWSNHVTPFFILFLISFSPCTRSDSHLQMCCFKCNWNSNRKHLKRWDSRTRLPCHHREIHLKWRRRHGGGHFVLPIYMQPAWINVISNVYQHREQIYETRHRISFIYLFIFNTQLMGNMGKKKEIGNNSSQKLLLTAKSRHSDLLKWNFFVTKRDTRSILIPSSDVIEICWYVKPKGKRCRVWIGQRFFHDFPDVAIGEPEQVLFWMCLWLSGRSLSLLAFRLF